jgi:hypothetical protein
MAKQSSISIEVADKQVKDLSALNQASMDTFVRGCQRWMEGAVEFNTEVMNFVGSRLRHDAEFAERLARCDNWNDASKVQQAWVKQATEEYAAETGKLVDVAARVTADSMKPLTESTEQVLTALNARRAA